MANAVHRICPKCGRKAFDSLQIQCPDCHVAFVQSTTPKLDLDNPATAFSWSSTPSPSGQGGVGQLMLSAKLVVILLILMSLAAYGFVEIAQRTIKQRSEETIREMAARDSNLLAKAVGTISGQVSNQITAQFAQPKIQSAIEKAARDQVNRVVTSKINPSLQTFQDAIAAANALLADSSNAIEEIRSNAIAAQARIASIPEPKPQVVDTDAIARQTAAAKPAAPVNPATNAVVKLTLINQGVTRSGTNYILSLVFRSNGNSGPVDVAAATYKQTARILDFSSINTLSQDPVQMNDTADVAKMRFIAPSDSLTSLVMTLSSPTIVRIVSDSFESDLTIPVQADRMVVNAN